MQKKILFIILIFITMGLAQHKNQPTPKSYHLLSLKKIDQDIRRISASQMTNQEKMVYYSSCFLDAPYVLNCEGEGENGFYETQPLLNLRQVNCMTFCEIVLALSLSSYYEEFFSILQHIRYRHGIISMATRNHYTMADWLPENEWCLRDVTKEIGGKDATELTRVISHKNFFRRKGITDLPQILPDRKVTIAYIPFEKLPQHEVDLQSGDIVSLIQNKEDIFSAHMLMIIKKEEGTYFRHASMKAGKVLDEPFKNYIASVSANPRYMGMSFMRIREDVDWLLPPSYRGKIVLPKAEKLSSLWIIADSTVLPQNQPVNKEIEQLLQLLASNKGNGRVVEKSEFLELLQKASPEVYEDKLIKYATPQSITLQNKDHEKLSNLYLQEKWLQRGVEFVKDHFPELEKAEQTYQVAIKDIVSILLWESRLGEVVGDYLIFNIFLGQILYLDEARNKAIEDMTISDSLDTLSAERTPKETERLERIKKNAVRNLAALVRISKEKGVDPITVKGSWGGAIGYVQFMPTSMVFAVDGDNNGQIDLFSWPDAIASVANYLKKNGYGSSEKSRRRAILAYNPLNSYVDGVIAYADAFWKKYEKEIKVSSVTQE